MSMLRPALQRLQQSRFIKAYLLALERRPLTTKCTTSGLLMVGADATRQRLEDAEQPYDAPRTARLTAFAILIHAPFLHAYHPIAERLWARYDIRHTVVKVGLDQAFSAPVFLSIFLSFTALAFSTCVVTQLRKWWTVSRSASSTGASAIFAQTPQDVKSCARLLCSFQANSNSSALKLLLLSPSALINDFLPITVQSSPASIAVCFPGPSAKYSDKETDDLSPTPDRFSVSKSLCTRPNFFS